MEKVGATIKWEAFHSTSTSDGRTWAVYRTKVPGGWLLLVHGDGLAFYPDPNHEWDGSSL